MFSTHRPKYHAHNWLHCYHHHSQLASLLSPPNSYKTNITELNGHQKRTELVDQRVTKMCGGESTQTLFLLITWSVAKKTHGCCASSAHLLWSWLCSQSRNRLNRSFWFCKFVLHSADVSSMGIKVLHLLDSSNNSVTHSSRSLLVRQAGSTGL